MKSWKISLMAVVFSLALVSFGFAGSDNPGQGNPNDTGNGGQGNHYGWGDGNDNGDGNNNGNNGNNGNHYGWNKNKNNNKNKNTNINTNINSNKNINFNSNKNTNINSMNNRQTISPRQTVNINEARQSLDAPEINPFYLVPLQNGKIVDYTNTLPRFKNPALVKLQANDVVVKVLGVYFGYPWNRITAEEIEEYLLEKADGYDGSKGNIRYTVKYQDSVITSGMGGGGAISDTTNGGMTSSTGAILPGATKSTANPIFIITFYEVEPYVVTPPATKVVEKVVVKEVEKVVVKEVAGPAKLINLDYTAFNHDSAKLTTDAMEILDKNAQVLKENPELKVSIEGYTSMSGETKYNQKLSEKRAAAVKAYLVKVGVAADRLSTIGYGESKAIHEQNPNWINSKIAKENRKVMFVIVK